MSFGRGCGVAVRRRVGDTAWLCRSLHAKVGKMCFLTLKASQNRGVVHLLWPKLYKDLRIKNRKTP